jgi:hypothetical protein
VDIPSPAGDGRTRIGGNRPEGRTGGYGTDIGAIAKGFLAGAGSILRFRDRLPSHRPFRAVVGFFLCIPGARILLSRPADRPAEPVYTFLKCIASR